jgi:hypothetical protein
MMRRIVPVFMSAVAALAVASAAHAQAPSPQSPAASVPDRPGVVQVDRLRTTATVEAIDRDTRTVTLKGPAGRLVSIVVPPEARNFDQISVGDTVRAEYLDAVAVVVRKAGAPPDARETTTVSVAPKGEKPSGVLIDTVEVTATVGAVDYGQRLLTLRGPGGGSRVVKVDDRVQRLDEVKPGDEVVVRHTEAIGITVDK